MIDINLNVKIRNGSEADHEALRQHLLRTVMQYIFDAAEQTAQANTLMFSHRSIIVDGEIKLKGKE